MEPGAPSESAVQDARVRVSLRQGLIATYGPEVGAEAAAACMAYAGVHRERTRSSSSPIRHLYRVGRRRSPWFRRRPLRLPAAPESLANWIEPGLPGILQHLPRRQRVALVLRHGYGWPTADIAEMLGRDAAVVEHDIDKAVTSVRSGLGAGDRMRDATGQIAAYAELLDQQAPRPESGMDSLGEPPSRRLRLGWVGVAAAAAAVAVVGGIAARDRPAATTVPSPDATGAAAATTLTPVVVDMLNPQAVTTAMFSEQGHAFAGPGAAIRYGDEYHMLSAAYGNGLGTVVYVTSDDGIVWTQGAADPVVDLAEAPWAPLEFDHALPRSVVVDDSGNWQLFFEISWFDRVTETARTNIGRVVAASPTGSWTFDAEPLIRPDEAVLWRAKGVASPSVARVEGGFVMLFVGVGDPAGGVVGIAQSRDGATWDVRPGPVFAASQGWEGGAIARVDLVAIDGGLAMFYSGDTTSRRGLALSTNGLDWDPYPANPVLTTADVPRGSMFDSEFIVDGSNVLAYVEGGGRRTSRQVVVLRLNLDLPMLIKPMLIK